MDWIKTVRAYSPAIVAAIASFLAKGLLAPLRTSPYTVGIFEILRWGTGRSDGIRALVR